MKGKNRLPDDYWPLVHLPERGCSLTHFDLPVFIEGEQMSVSLLSHLADTIYYHACHHVTLRLTYYKCV